jgi:hypothetical protein
MRAEVPPPRTFSDMSRKPDYPVTGASLIRSSWWTLRADPELIVLPILGGIASSLSVVPFLFAYFVAPERTADLNAAVIVGATFVSLFMYNLFATAFAAGANERMDGGDPTVRSAFAVAWRRRRAVAQWSVLATIVTVILNTVRSASKRRSSALAEAGEIAWKVASYFVLPIVVLEDGVSGWGALKRSQEMLRERFGKVVGVEVRILFLQLPAVCAAMVLYYAAPRAFEYSFMAGSILFGVSMTIIVTSLMILNAISVFARVALYRYATGRPVPGFDPAMLNGSVITE